MPALDKGFRIGLPALESLTTGMYDNALTIYREYVQNATDALDEAIALDLVNRDEAAIYIDINPETRKVTIRDNGIGIHSERAWSNVVNIGASEKFSKDQRGFRGIGRLGGLAYCDRLQFRTGAAGDPQETTVEWDCGELRRLLRSKNANKLDLDETIKKVTAHVTSSKNMDDHYFEVVLENVTDESLLDLNEVTAYIGEVAPLPYHAGRFTFCSIIHDWVKEHGKELEEYNVYINNSPEPLYKPYQTFFHTKIGKRDDLSTIRTFEATDDSGKLLFLGWYGVNKQYLGQISPSESAFRGLRLRSKNILVGNEDSLSHLFTQKRFNKWFMGEIFVYSELVPNARRDNFEKDTIEYKTFEEKLQPWTKDRLSKIPPKASDYRKKEKALDDFAIKIDRIDKRAELGFVSPEVRRKDATDLDRIKRTVSKIVKVTKEPSTSNLTEDAVISYPKHFNEKGKELIERIKHSQEFVDQCKYAADNISSCYSKDVKKAIAIAFQAIEDVCRNTKSDPEPFLKEIICRLNQKQEKK